MARDYLAYPEGEIVNLDPFEAINRQAAYNQQQTAEARRYLAPSRNFDAPDLATNPFAYGLARAQQSAYQPAPSTATRRSDRAEAQGVDYLGGTPAQVRAARPTSTRSPEEEASDAAESYYRFQLSQNNPDALRRRDFIGQQRISGDIAANYYASLAGRQEAFRDRLNSGALGPTATGGDSRLTDPYGLGRSY